MGYQIFDLARKINREVNRNTTYRSDPELYGRVEFWNPARGEMPASRTVALFIQATCSAMTSLYPPVSLVSKTLYD